MDKLDVGRYTVQCIGSDACLMGGCGSTAC